MPFFFKDSLLKVRKGNFQRIDVLGLGSIWIHLAKEEFETPEYKRLLKDIGIEGDATKRRSARLPRVLN